MYKLMIVDDEQSIRNGMANGIPWNDWGFEVISLASDGIEALELIKENKPDVVISDIKMPKMDGVELMQKLKKDYPDIKMIILSGYNDFEYLNMAIKNSIVEYLLKPTDIDEFEECFKRIKKTIDDERSHIDEFEKNRTYYLDSVLNIYLMGYMDDEIADVDKKLIKDFGIDVANCVVAMLSVDWNGEKCDEATSYKKRLRLRDLCNECAKNINNTHHYFMSDTERIVAIISNMDEPLSKEKIFSELKYLIDNISGKVDGEIYIAVGDMCNKDNTISNSYEQALGVLHKKMFKTKQNIEFYIEPEQTQTKYRLINFNYKIIGDSIISNDIKKIYGEIERVFDLLTETDDYQYITRICLELLFYLSRWALKYNIDFDLMMSDIGFTYDEISKMVGTERRKVVITLVINELCERVEKQIGNYAKNNTLAKSIKDYVDDEYLKNYMSLEYIAGKVKKSATYVSKIFKDEYGCNFSEYITEKRLERSKELLEDATIKIYEIAEMTGYADVSNFIKVFKKKYGISPGDYRNFMHQ